MHPCPCRKTLQWDSRNSITEIDEKNQCVTDYVASAGNVSMCQYVAGYKEGYNCRMVVARANLCEVNLVVMG